jgi:hypothetical protein
MAFEAATLLQLVLSWTWTCLFITPVTQKNPLFSQIIPSQAVLEELASMISLQFAPGLFEVLQGPAPPTILYFQTLLTLPIDVWAVYLLVLTKSGHRPRIYIGSGTSSAVGVHSRFHQYDERTQLPYYVQKSLDKGYEIVHKGLLCWISIPKPSLQPRIQSLFLTLEAALAYIFWVIRTVTKGYGMAHMCHWDWKTLEYDG